MQDPTDSLDLIAKNLDETRRLIVALSVILGLNVIMLFVKFRLDLLLKNMEKNVFWKNLVASKSLKLQSELYALLNDLTLFTAQETTEMLAKVQEIESIKRKKNIYLSKPVDEQINKMLDHFKSVVFDYPKNKSYLKEEQLFSDFNKHFNKL